jgi:hypothetical protein
LLTAQAVGEEALHGGLLEVAGGGDQAVLGGDGALQLPQDSSDFLLLECRRKWDFQCCKTAP